MRAPKLKLQEQMEMVKLIAWFWRDREIIDHLKEKTGKTLCQKTINQYRETKKWKPIIEKLREDYNKAMYDVPLFHKRKRLDELQKLYDNHIRFSRLRDAQSVLRDIRDEVEHKFGDVSFHFTQVTNNQYSEMSDEDIMKEKERLLNQMDHAKRMKKLLEDKRAERTGTQIEITG